MLNLSKGSKLNLTKEAPSLKNLLIGLKWGAQQYDGSADFDLDATAFMLSAGEKCLSEDRIVGYVNPDGKDKSGAVSYGGDNRTGGSGADWDETITVSLDTVPSDVEKVSFVCTIYQAKERKQSFGMVSNCIMAGIDADTGKQLFEFDLGEDYSSQTAIVAAEVYKHNGEWKFNAVAAGYDEGLAAICSRYGIEAENG